VDHRGALPFDAAGYFARTGWGGIERGGFASFAISTEETVKAGYSRRAHLRTGAVLSWKG